MSDDFRSFVVKWLPAIAEPLGLQAAATNVTSRLDAQSRALGLFREIARKPPVRHSYAALLHPEWSPVPFGFRDQDIWHLKEWCNTPPNGSPLWRLVIGDTGRGKTRLLMRLVEELNGSLDHPWRAGFVDVARVRSQPIDLLCLRELTEDLLLVIDYAERFESETVSVMKAALAIAEDRPSRRVQLVLISRRKSELWDRIGRNNKEIGAFIDSGGLDFVELSPLAEELHTREAVFKSAYEAFERHYGELRPLEAAPNLEPVAFEDALLIHMASLSLYHRELDPIGLSEETLLHWVLSRERRLWNEMVDGKGLPASLRDSPIEQAAAYLTLITLSEGITSRQDAVEHLQVCPELRGVDGPTLGQIAQIFHELYPGPAWANGVTPDLVGTYLLSESSDEFVSSVFAQID